MTELDFSREAVPHLRGIPQPIAQSETDNFMRAEVLPRLWELTPEARAHFDARLVGHFEPNVEVQSREAAAQVLRRLDLTQLQGITKTLDKFLGLDIAPQKPADTLLTKTEMQEAAIALGYLKRNGTQLFGSLQRSAVNDRLDKVDPDTIPSHRHPESDEIVVSVRRLSVNTQRLLDMGGIGMVGYNLSLELVKSLLPEDD